MSGFHLCAVHADLPSFHCSVKSCFWSMGGQKCTWCSTYGLISGVYNGVHVSPLLLEMPWFVRKHSRRGEKSSFCGHISKDSPQGTLWVHKEGIYAERVQTKRVCDTGGAGSRATVQETLTVALLSSNRITPIKRWQQLQADGHFKHRRFLQNW